MAIDQNEGKRVYDPEAKGWEEEAPSARRL
jgi:hypothetical protein